MKRTGREFWPVSMAKRPEKAQIAGLFVFATSRGYGNLLISVRMRAPYAPYMSCGSRAARRNLKRDHPVPSIFTSTAHVAEGRSPFIPAPFFSEIKKNLPGANRARHCRVMRSATSTLPRVGKVHAKNGIQGFAAGANSRRP
jgi:hypothetical protein